MKENKKKQSPLSVILTRLSYNKIITPLKYPSILLFLVLKD